MRADEIYTFERNPSLTKGERIGNTVQLETDQETCYDTLGKKVDCEGSGHDADYKRLSRTGFANRFEIAGNSVHDTLSGLVWKKHAGLSEFPLSWPEAQAFVERFNSTTTPAENHWRLPTRRELFSLVSHQCVNPSLPQEHPFSDVFNGYYWTGTTCSRLPDQAWYVHLGGGRVYRGMKHGSYMVWPVSKENHDSAGNENRFTANEHLFFDRYSGRHWYAGSSLLDRARNWEEAFYAIRRLNDSSKSGYRDWRLPNIRELESLVDDSRHSPALAQGFSPHKIAQVDGCWSSTTSVYEPRYAWVLYIVDGAIGVGFKASADFHTLAVRG